MNSIALLKHATELSTFAFRALAEDLADQPLTRVSPDGNHAMWCVGHVAVSDGMMVAMLTEADNPLQRWDALFRSGHTLGDHEADYPPYAEVLAAFDQNRQTILAGLDQLTEADLDRPNPQTPEGFEAFFGTLGKVAASVSLHTMHHRGQLADIRRKLSRPPLMA